MSLHPDEPNEGPLVEPDQDPIPPGEDPADDPSPEPDLTWPVGQRVRSPRRPRPPTD